MKFSRWMVLLWCGWLLAATTPAAACSLPAEPMGALIPMHGGPNATNANQLKIIEYNDSNGKPSFYYIIPQGTTFSFQVVWDPYDHNGGRLKDKYDWLPKNNYPMAPNTPVINDYGYFRLTDMKKFFQVTGNGNLMEAFQRETGNNVAANSFVPAELLGVQISLKKALQEAWIKSGQEGAVTFDNSEKAPGYGFNSTLCTPAGTDLDLDAANAEVPHIANQMIEPPGATDPPPPLTTAQKQATARPTYEITRWVDRSCGIFVGNMSVDLTDIRETDFKAYIENDPNGPGVWQNDDLPIGLENAVPGTLMNGEYIIRASFDTPTIGAGGASVNGHFPKEMIKVRVISPRAGFEVKNIWWCWKEETTTWVASGTAGDWVEWINPPTKSGPRPCSVKMVVKAYKPGGGVGHTAIVVYDSKPPIASKLTFNDPPTYRTGQPMSDPTDFTLEFIDSSPFANVHRVYKTYQTTGTQWAEQKKEFITEPGSLKLFYAYPVYTFTPESPLTLDDFKNPQAKPVGTVDLVNSAPDNPTWKGNFYKVDWVWKEASVSNVDATFAPQPADNGLRGGGVWTVTGKATFSQPAPWHFANEGSTPGSIYESRSTKYPSQKTVTDLTKMMKVFAIIKDSVGLPSVAYDGIASMSQTAPNDTAASQHGSVVHPITGGALTSSYNQKPPLTQAISNLLSYTASPYPWQKEYAYMKVEDASKPEIQVIVFDTRNNCYHTFGTKAGGNAKLTNLGTHAQTSYVNLNPVPYSDADATNIKTGLTFDAIDFNMFDKFFNKNGDGAVSTLVTGNERKAFVCKKNTRLFFYIRAWDNIDTFKIDPLNPAAPNQGIKNLTYSVTDNASPINDARPSYDGAYNPNLLFTSPPEWQFRAANWDGAANLTTAECSFTVTASDLAGNTQTLKLTIAVADSGVEIRSLEERRNRSY
jgi:hypothetical protein